MKTVISYARCENKNNLFSKEAFIADNRVALGRVTRDVPGRVYLFHYFFSPRISSHSKTITTGAPQMRATRATT